MTLIARWIARLLLALLVVVQLSKIMSGRAVPINLVALVVARREANATPGAFGWAATVQSALAAGDCREIWLNVGSAFTKFNGPLTDQILQRLANCRGPYLYLLQARFPNDKSLAKRVVAQQPQAPAAWFWVAEQQRLTDVDQAIESYRQGLALQPSNGMRWCELGFVLTSVNLESAEGAYLQCCYHGDKGSNGCYNAGLISEQLGDFTQAIIYLRLSNWQVALAHADELEDKIKAAQAP